MVLDLLNLTVPAAGIEFEYPSVEINISTAKRGLEEVETLLNGRKVLVIVHMKAAKIDKKSRDYYQKNSTKYFSAGIIITGSAVGNMLGKFFMGLGPFGGLLSLLLFILIIYFFFKIARSFIPNPEATSDKKDSLVILKTRFAKGEITQEEYENLGKLI